MSAKQIVSKNTFLFAIGPSPIAANVITTANDIVVVPKATSEEYKDAGAGAGSTKAWNNPDLVTADFNVEVTARASGAAGVPPKIAPLLKACGFSEDITVDEKVVYTPTLAQTQGTAKAYLDGEVREITGIAGSFSIKGEIGKFAQFNFSLKGFTDLVPTLEANPTVTLDDNEKLSVLQATLKTDGGTPIDLKSFELDVAMETEEHYGGESKEYQNKDFKPTMKIKAIKEKDDLSHWQQLENNAIKEVLIVLGSGAGKQLEIRASYCAVTNLNEDPDKGIMVYEKTYLCQSNTGADNCSFTYK